MTASDFKKDIFNNPIIVRTLLLNFEWQVLNLNILLYKYHTLNKLVLFLFVLPKTIEALG